MSILEYEKNTTFFFVYKKHTNIGKANMPLGGEKRKKDPFQK